MELNAEYVAFWILHRRDGVFSASRHFKLRWRFQDSIAVTHPDLTHPIQQRRWPHGFQFTRSELAVRRRFDTPAENLPDQLHAITDAEHRHTELENAGVADRRIAFVHRSGATAEDETFRFCG